MKGPSGIVSFLCVAFFSRNYPHTTVSCRHKAIFSGLPVEIMSGSSLDLNWFNFLLRLAYNVTAWTGDELGEDSFAMIPGCIFIALR